MSESCILVVEDEPLIRDILVAELCDAGFRVMAVADAREASDVCRDYRIDLIFVDIRRPGSPEGWAVAEQLRARIPECPIVYATLGGPSRDVPLAWALRRPFSTADALAAIVQAGKSAAASPAAGTVKLRRTAGCPPASWESLAL